MTLVSLSKDFHRLAALYGIDFFKKSVLGKSNNNVSFLLNLFLKLLLLNNDLTGFGECPCNKLQSNT